MAFGERPATWREFVYGMAAVRRAASREVLRLADAARMGRVESAADFQKWRATHEADAGF